MVTIMIMLTSIIKDFFMLGPQQKPKGTGFIIL
jgi:hypothetical protein